MLPTFCALKAVTAETHIATISVIKLIERLKSGYTLREFIFADFTDSDFKKIKNWFEEILKMTWPTKINSGNFYYFWHRKKYLKFLIPKYLYFLP